MLAPATTQTCIFMMGPRVIPLYSSCLLRYLIKRLLYLLLPIVGTVAVRGNDLNEAPFPFAVGFRVWGVRP